MTINFQPLLLRPNVAARQLGISIAALRHEARRGAIAQCKVAGRIYFRPEALVAYVEALAEAAPARDATKGTTAKRPGRMSAGDKPRSSAQAGAEALAAWRAKQTANRKRSRRFDNPR